MIKTPKKISSHIARHSFADYARIKGIGIYDISKLLGHSSISVTERYLASLDISSSSESMKKLFG